MATIELRITRQGTRVYRVKIRRRGLSPRSATFPDLPAAKAWAGHTEATLLAHRALPPAHRHTLAEAIDRYVQEVLPRKSRASETMQTIQLRWWRNQVGERSLAELTPALVVQCREQLARGDHGTLRAPATVNRYLAALSHVCRPSENEAATSGNVALPTYKTVASSTSFSCAPEVKISMPELIQWELHWHIDNGTGCGTASKPLSSR